MKNTALLIDAIAVPVIGCDKNMRVILANPEATEAFPDVCKGSKFTDIAPENRELKKALQKVVETGKEISLSLATVDASNGLNTEYLVTLRCLPEKARAKNIALIATFEDQSHLGDVKAMRSDFVANVSHEIRSPLTAISGFVETLQGEAQNDAATRELFLNLMDKEVERMTNLVRDLLSLSQLEVKERRTPKKGVEPLTIIRQAEESANAFARKHGKTLSVRINDALPVTTGNHNELVRVLINLLENAVTYSAPGTEVTLTVDLLDGNNPLGRPAIRLSVKDKGEGIPAAEIPRLTERFYRVDKSRSRNAGGTGLGLAIVKHIVQRHLGKLEIRSTLGEGSEFCVFLPIRTPKKYRRVSD